jgi:hypothetical protein
LAHHLATLVGATIGAPDYAAKAQAEAKAAEIDWMRKRPSALLPKTSCTAEHANAHRWLACRC